jgi:hypothetical protein
MSANPQPARPGGAWDGALLAPVAELNQQMLAVLQRLALEHASEHRRSAPRLVSALKDEWQRLDAKAQRRLSACPYLLLDAGFSNLHRWERMLSVGVMDAAARSSYFESSGGVALIRRMLLLAWHLARSNRLMTGVILGCQPGVAERIAAIRLSDLDMLAELAPSWIVPRWEQQPMVWQQLIGAACSAHPLMLRQAQLRGLQLLAREHTRA